MAYGMTQEQTVNNTKIGRIKSSPSQISEMIMKF